MKTSLALALTATVATTSTTLAFTHSTSTKVFSNNVADNRLKSFVLENGSTDATGTALSLTGGSAVAEEPAGDNKFLEVLQIGTYFALWYFFNIGYNIYNKQALNVLDFP